MGHGPAALFLPAGILAILVAVGGLLYRYTRSPRQAVWPFWMTFALGLLSVTLWLQAADSFLTRFVRFLGW